MNDCKAMFEQAIRALAAIDDALGIGSDGCGDLNQTLTAIKELREELADSDALRDRMADLLTRTANAIRGEPEPLKRHGWQDLPERAQALMAELASARADEREAMKPAIIKALQAHEKGVERGGCFDETLCVSDDDYEDVAEEAVAIRARGEA